MKKISVAALALLMSVCPLASMGGNLPEEEWHDGKYSMFIHFGLYSVLGGVWDGKPVTQGYSEQIQSFAGIFSDWYALTADELDPTAFDADSIVALAERAGMKSIVFTSKHHDGFCMFGTETTDFNSVDATPCGRDFVRELSQACAKAGMRFGLYFSIIDWHYPYAYPISSHNADFVTPQHHELNKAQVTELLTKYGPISELWFDMGSQTPGQSHELYTLVHSLQPDCMVSGRIGNDFYDFSVMGDNRYPDGALQAPWQTAASMFNETWSYRSWQERGSVFEKAMEKLRSLIRVVSHGGNYLLNIGPDGTGAVVPFERDVLLTIGKWLDENGSAIYGTEASPFREDFEWGAVTRKDNVLNLIFSGKRPADGEVVLRMPGYSAVSVLRRGDAGTGKAAAADAAAGEDNAVYRQEGDWLTVSVPEYGEDEIPVVSIVFDRRIEPLSEGAVECAEGSILSGRNAVKDYSYSCFDYYSNYRSTVAYSWEIMPGRKFGRNKDGKRVRIVHTSSENGRKIRLSVNGESREYELKGSQTVNPDRADYSVEGAYMQLYRASSFDTPDTVAAVTGFEGWSPMPQSGEISVKSHPFGNCRMVLDVVSDKERDLVLDVVSGNGMELYVNGKLYAKHLNPYRSGRNCEKVVVRLVKGNNQILLRSYNRFENVLYAGLSVSPEQGLCADEVELPAAIRAGVPAEIRIEAADTPSEHTDGKLHNISIVL